jgi:tetrahydromethanopterin S-methyltransferase subunit F
MADLIKLDARAAQLYRGGRAARLIGLGIGGILSVPHVKTLAVYAEWKESRG